jgi:hypothetical protein
MVELARVLPAQNHRAPDLSHCFHIGHRVNQPRTTNWRHLQIVTRPALIAQEIALTLQPAGCSPSFLYHRSFPWRNRPSRCPISIRRCPRSSALPNSEMINSSAAVPRLYVPALDWWDEGLHGVARAG